MAERDEQRPQAPEELNPRTRRSHPQGKYWILTMPQHTYVPHPHSAIEYSKGQLEQGEGGYLHWQVIVGFKKKTRLLGVKKIFGQECHAELTRSDAADDYVMKEETRIEGTRFQLINKIVYF